MNIYNSKFFTYNDPTSDKVLLKIPHEWWSRLYEYHWASLFADSNDVCLDAACGVLHPFKFFLASACKEVYGCDLSILNRDIIASEMRYYFDNNDINLAMSYFDKLDLRTYNLVSLGYESDKFDKVYCISTLEHLDPNDIPKALSEIYRVLKPGGLFVLTVDYPSVDLNTLIDAIKAVNFKFVGDIDTTKPDNAVYTTLFGGLYCYRILVQK